MAFKPLIALHKNADGKILDAGAFDYSFKIADWLRALDVQPGDRIEFGEKLDRKEVTAEPCEYAPIAEPINMASVAAKVLAS